MACIEYIYSVSALVGSSACNANCSFCAAKDLRKDANPNNELYYRNLEAAIKLSARYGGWSLSLTSSGEPTCSPEALTKALEVYSKCAKEGAFFPNVVLFTNGIKFADKHFCKKWLPIWKELGLNNIAISVHSVDLQKQAEVYGIKNYPSFQLLKQNIEEYGIGIRVTLLLRKGEIDCVSSYKNAVDRLISYGINNITSWPIGEADNSRNEFTPTRLNLLKIRLWLRTHCKICHGHIWGGGVFDYNGSILRYTTYVTKHKPRKPYVRQLVVFQDATVAYSWIRKGALCLK